MVNVGAARGTVFQERRPGAGLKPGDSVKEKLEGGYRRRTTRGFSIIVPKMSADGLVLTRQGDFGLIILVLVCGVSSLTEGRGKSAVDPHL